MSDDTSDKVVERYDDKVSKRNPIPDAYTPRWLGGVYEVAYEDITVPCRC